MKLRVANLLSCLLVGTAAAMSLFSGIARPAPAVSPASQEAGHELSDANSKGILGFGFSLVLGAIVVFVLLGSMFFALRRLGETRSAQVTGGTAPRLLQENIPPPEPRLQPDPAGDLQQYLKQERTLLSTYGWIDREKGVARIPVERAMALYLEQAGKRGGTP